MRQSQSITALATALAKAQGELEGAKKDSTNPHFRSKYADLASVVEALRACFPRHGLSYVQTVVTSDAAVGVETMLLHASGEHIAGDPFLVPVNKADAQGFGSALTYARRYSLSAITGVAPEDDDGNAATAARPDPKPITAKQVAVDAFEELPAEAQQITREWAMEVIAMVDGGDVAGAWSFAHEKCHDNEGKLALWSQLPSNVRTKMQKHQREQTLASQA